MSRPRALDLFCAAGGSAVGLRRAGFEVVGVDIERQPRYPFEFHLADALTYPLDDFDFIWASPPCQAYTSLRHAPNTRQDNPRLIERVRRRLRRSGLPYVIENVVGAPLVKPVTLCGSQFGLGVGRFQLRRHRLIEASFPLTAPPCRHDGPVIGVYGGHVRCRSAKFWRETAADFPGEDRPALAAAAMRIDWMTMGELSEAIPPAYAEYVGRAARRAL